MRSNILNLVWKFDFFRGEAEVYIIFQKGGWEGGAGGKVFCLEIYIDVRFFPKGNFPSGNFPNVQFSKRQLPKCAISQAATSQVCPSHSALPPAYSSSARPSLKPASPHRAWPNLWEVAAWEIAHLGNCHLGKYPWEVATWEKSFEKVPNTEIYSSG